MPNAFINTKCVHVWAELRKDVATGHYDDDDDDEDNDDDDGDKIDVQAKTTPRATCVFEQNSGLPLRRHLSYAKDEGGFFGGMADSALVVRFIITVSNYDYIIDFIFYQVDDTLVLY